MLQKRWQTWLPADLILSTILILDLLRWINETVFACVVCYQFGLAAPVWFGSGLAFQIALMAVLGVLAKIRVPYAHTSLEFIKRRYGRSGHAVFILLNLINNVLGCSSMIVAGSQVLVGISGINLAAATILLPLGGEFMRISR